MKKHFLLACSTVVALLMTACAEEELSKGQGGNVVTFDVGVPQMSTRAVGDGFTANRLYWGVYDHNGVLLTEISNTDADAKEDMPFEGTGKVSLTLAQDKSYSIIFWAANADNSMCAVDWDGRTMSVSPAEANQESYDAFCAYEVIDNVSGYMTREVKLYRPFAQLNIGTADYDKAAASGLTVENTKVVIEGLPTKYNFVDGTTEGNSTFTYGYPDPVVDVRGDIDGDGTKEVFPVEDDTYDYLAMNYALVAKGKDQGLVTVTFTYLDDDQQEHERTYSSVPMQRNWRTNIYGNILTSEADFTVTIEPEFADAHDIKVWDGKTVEEPAVETNDEGEFSALVTKGSQLAYIAQMVNGSGSSTRSDSETEVDYSKVNIKLGANIDLGNELWTPIGTSDKHFEGTLDGDGFTISNLNIVEDEAKEGKAYIGLFGYAKNVTIKNLTIENVNINIPCLDIDHSQGHIGAVAGSLEGTSTIENVTVKGDIKVYATQDANGASRVAVVAGGNAYGDVTMKNVHVKANEGSSLIANNNTGALAGQLQGKMYFENCSSNIDVTVNKFFAGGLIGIAAGDSKFVNCHTTGDVAVVAGREGRANDHYRVGGIAGGWADGKEKVCTLENCSYEGNISGKNADGSVAESLDYDGYVGRGYTLTNCAGSKVIIDGKGYVQAFDKVYGIYIVDGKYVADNQEELQTIIDNTPEGDITIVLASNIAGDVTILQKENINLTIDGNGNKYNGAITVNGNARANGTETLTFKNINFDAADATEKFTFISAPSKINNKYNYSHNVTIENCTFTGNYPEAAEVGSANFTGTYNFVMKNCTATKMHSILQIQSCDNTVLVEGVTATDCKNGISFGNTAYPTLKNSTINAAEYGVRADGNASRGNLVVESTAITANTPIFVRKITTDSYAVKLDESTTLTTNANYHVVFSGKSDDETLEFPTGKYTLEGCKTNYKVYPAVPGVVYDAAGLEAALKDENVTEIKLAPYTFGGTFVMRSGVTIMSADEDNMPTVGCINLNGADNVTLKNINFDAANAVMGCDGKGKGKQYANIITGDATNKPDKGAWNLVIDGCTFTGTFANGGASIAFTDQNRVSGASGNVTIQNCIFDTKKAYYNIYGHYTGNGGNGYGDFVIENNIFKTAFTQGRPVYLGRYASSTPVVVKGNTFKTVASLDNAVYVQDHSNYGVSVAAENNTFAE